MIITQTVYKDTSKKSAKLSTNHSTLHLTLPLGISDAEEERFAEFAKQEIAIKLSSQIESRKLLTLALYLDKKYLKRRHQTLLGKPFFSIKYVSNQRKSRWASCTKRNGYGFGIIRLSHSLIHAPQYVINNVIIHELAHLDEMNHSMNFRVLAGISPYHFKAEAWISECKLGWSDEMFDLDQIIEEEDR